MTLQPGDLFRIDDSAYRDQKFLVLDVDHNFTLTCRDRHGDIAYFSTINLEHYGEAVTKKGTEIVPEPQTLANGHRSWWYRREWESFGEAPGQAPGSAGGLT